MLSYALKRIVRSWKLFVALILGMVLAATFFGGINVGADTIGRQALDKQLESTPFDLRLQSRFSSSITSPAATFQSLASTVSQVNGVASTEVRGDAEDQSNFTLPSMRAIPDGSSLYGHMAIAGAIPSSPNQTLVSSTSNLAKTLKVGDTVTYHLNQNGNARYNVTLKIVGFATLDPVASNTFNPAFTGSFFFGGFLSSNRDLLIVSWQQTYARIVDWAYQRYFTTLAPASAISAYVDVYLDRGSLISASDVTGSASRITQVEARISNLASQYGFAANDYVLGPLASLAPTILALRVSFTVFSIPVFFMAWYVGRTVSQASYNLRRREIGLLMTKGFSRGQLFRHFLAEALLVGLLAGVMVLDWQSFSTRTLSRLSVEVFRAPYFSVKIRRSSQWSLPWFLPFCP